MQLWFASADGLIRSTQVDNTSRRTSCRASVEAPGIVSGFWMIDMAGATLNVLVFESKDAARSAMQPVRTAPRPPWMQLESADVYEVLAHF
jgi:hypothetical protein